MGTNKINILVGGSGVGKTTLVDYLTQTKNFIFIEKATTRTTRGDDDDSNCFKKGEMPMEYDIAYPQFGEFYALKSTDIHRALEQNKNPLVVLNSFQGVQEVRNLFGDDNVLVTYVHREPTGQNSIINQRENSALRELSQFSLYKQFGYNLTSLDGVIINNGDIESLKTQASNLFSEFYSRKKKIYFNGNLFIISGHESSGKRDLISFIEQFKKDEYVSYKQTTREKRDSWGEALSYVPQISNSLIYEHHGHQYGIDLEKVKEQITEGKNVYLVLSKNEVIDRIKLEVLQTKVLYIHKDVDLNNIKQDLEKKGLDDCEIQKRIDTILKKQKEYEENPHRYDFVLLNTSDSNEGCIDQMLSLINN